MALTTLELDATTRDRLKALKRGDESYDTLLNALMDFLDGTGVVLPWPRRSLALWRQMRAQGNRALTQALESVEMNEMP